MRPINSTGFILGPVASAFAPVAGRGNVFYKDVLVEGAYQHPVQPWDEPLLVTKDYIERVCAATNAAIVAGQKVYVPDGHSSKAADNTGYATEFVPALADNGKWVARARLEIEDATYVPKIGKTIRDVSPSIVGYPLGTGDSFGERIAHVALVPDPVMPGQGDFVACSLASGTNNPVNIPVLKPVVNCGVEPMKIKVTESNLKFLSLSGETLKVNDEVEVSTVEKALSVAVTAKESAETALATERAKPAATVERLLSVDGKSNIFFAEARKATAKALSATLDGAMKAGRMNKAMRDAAERLLSVRHGYALSETGAAETVAVADLVETFIGAIPDNSVVPLGTAGTQPAAGASQKPAEFDAHAEADRALERAGYKTPAKK